MHGDTVINSISYNRIYYERNIYAGPYSPANVLVPYKYLGAMRQDSINKLVYYRGALMQSDTLLYDFNMGIGDTLPKTYMTSYLYNNNIVNSIDSTLFGGEYYKQFNFTGSVVYGHLIEGVGSDCGFFEIMGHWEGGPSLTCFKTHNLSPSSSFGGPYSSCGYYSFPLSTNEISDDHLFSVYPNPSTGIINLSLPDKISQIIVSDILGQELYKSSTSSLFGLSLDLSYRSKGIYFVKVVDEKGNFGVRKIVLQ